MPRPLFLRSEPWQNNKTFFPKSCRRPSPGTSSECSKCKRGCPRSFFLGTTSWSNEDWEGLIYPEGCAAADYIEHYAKAFRSVEIDSTWYRVPTPKAIEGWLRRTPPHFRFTAKIPRVISHEKMLVDCMGDMEEFLDAMAPLGERLGPLLMQFPYIARGQDAHENEYGSAFTERLAEFLPQLPYGRVPLCSGGAQRKLGCERNCWTCYANMGWRWC